MDKQPVSAEESSDAAPLLNEIRTHLTVAMLAAYRLRVTHPDTTSVAHLFAYLTHAHDLLQHDLKEIEGHLR